MPTKSINKMVLKTTNPKAMIKI